MSTLHTAIRAAVAGAALLASPAHARDGDLDRGFGTNGTTVISSSRHSPMGIASGTLALGRSRLVGATGPMVTEGSAAASCADPVVLASRAEPESSDPVAPTSLPIPKTRARATTSTRVRRTQ